MPTLPLIIDVEQSLVACGRQNAHGACKTTEDIERYRRVIAATQPDVIVECGTWHGGSALVFAQSGVDVITIDIDAAMTVWHERITQVVGRSTDPAVVADVTRRVTGRRVMVVLDSDHSAAYVRQEILAYGPLVSPGCYLVVEDGVVRWMTSHPWQGSPLDAIEDALADNPSWQRDTITEGLYPVSMNPAGWWIKLGDETLD